MAYTGCRCHQRCGVGGARRAKAARRLHAPSDVRRANAGASAVCLALRRCFALRCLRRRRSLRLRSLPSIALNSNPTLATIEKLGGTKKKGEKQLTLDEFLPIYSQAKKDKDQGQYEDFLECLKLYDKNENGLMLGAELTHTLLALGEKLEDNEVAEVTKDCMDAEDDDGMIPYAPFLKKVMA